MKPREVAETLLRRMSGLYGGGAIYGVTTSGIEGTLQRDINQALEAWRATRDASELRQVVLTMHAYGKLTEAEYTQIMESLDGEE